MKLNQSCLARTCFPALGGGYMHLLRVLIGSLRCLGRFCLAGEVTLLLRHSIENRLTLYKLLLIIFRFSILRSLSQGLLDKKSVSLPPSNFFPSLCGYYKRPDEQIRKTLSEPTPKRKNVVKSFRSKVRFLPPIATIYPEDRQKGISLPKTALIFS